jgi:CheY-like chemotaxis protein/anti-sigma regulatory factor (Ser/Thr protein kinase)
VLTVTPAPDRRHRVQGDAAMLRQVLMNLVGNAVKFTRDGRISVELSHLSPHGMTEITVRDTGIGIQPEDLGRIFEDFVTLDPSYSRHASGTGLGLGIVRRIVTRIGGKITVDSVPGAGSTFRVVLPLPLLDAGQPEPAPDKVAAKVSGLSVLVVEDNDFNRLIVRDMLLAEHHGVTEAHDGLEGVKLARERRFDVILMDISMPGIDGLQAADLIRQGSGASKATPIVALTAHALHDETERFRAGGMADVLIKPITRDTLRAVLAGLPGTGVATSAKGDMTALVKPAAPVKPAAVVEQHAALLDMALLAEMRAGLGNAKADALLARFLTDTDQRLSDLAQQAGDETTEGELVGVVHRLTGAAAMFGATQLHRQLTLIEDLCKTGQKAKARTEVPKLLDLWQQTAEAYRRMGSLAQASSLR